jgi:hypothetical protein
MCRRGPFILLSLVPANAILEKQPRIPTHPSDNTHHRPWSVVMSKRKTAGETKDVSATAKKRKKSAATETDIHSLLPSSLPNPTEPSVWCDFLQYVAYRQMLSPRDFDTKLVAKANDPSTTDEQRQSIKRRQDARLGTHHILTTLISKLSATESPLFQYAACSIELQVMPARTRARDHTIKMLPNAYAFYWRDVYRIPKDSHEHMATLGQTMEAFEQALTDRPPAFAQQEFHVGKDLLDRLQAMKTLSTLMDAIDLAVHEWLGKNPRDGADGWFWKKLDMFHKEFPFTTTHQIFLKLLRALNTKE